MGVGNESILWLYSSCFPVSSVVRWRALLLTVGTERASPSAEIFRRVQVFYSTSPTIGGGPLKLHFCWKIPVVVFASRSGLFFANLYGPDLPS